MAQTEYTLWLLPAQPLAGRLRAVIRELALEFDAPEFDPHVTIYAGPSSANEARQIAEDIGGQFQPLDLEMQKLDQSAIYAKTVFVQFHESGTLRAMFDLARKSVAKPSGYALNPHLSLLYQHLSEQERLALCRRSIVPEGGYHFDGIRAVEFEPPWSEKTSKNSRTVTDLRLQDALFRVPSADR
jgi:Cyclic phosphodiesterase-like protein